MMRTATLALLALMASSPAFAHDRGHSHGHGHAHGHSHHTRVVTAPAYPRHAHTRVVYVDPWSPAWRPAPRDGYYWVAGYYDRYNSWVPGYWHPSYDRAGYAWVRGYWDGRTYVDGYWRPVRRSGHVWVDGYYGSRGWVAGTWRRGGSTVSVSVPVGGRHTHHRRR